MPEVYNFLIIEEVELKDETDGFWYRSIAGEQWIYSWLVILIFQVLDRQSARGRASNSSPG